MWSKRSPSIHISCYREHIHHSSYIQRHTWCWSIDTSADSLDVEHFIMRWNALIPVQIVWMLNTTPVALYHALKCTAAASGKYAILLSTERHCSSQVTVDECMQESVQSWRRLTLYYMHEPVQSWLWLTLHYMHESVQSWIWLTLHYMHESVQSWIWLTLHCMCEAVQSCRQLTLPCMHEPVQSWRRLTLHCMHEPVQSWRRLTLHCMHEPVQSWR